MSERTLRRDVERLRELGYPVDSVRGFEGGYQLGAGATMPPLTVDEDEAIAMVVALNGAAQLTSGALSEASVSGAVQGGPGAAAKAAATGRGVARGHR